MFRLVTVFGALCVAGCAQSLPSLPQGEAAYAAMPARSPGQVRDYRIGALDTLAISVFQEPDLSMKDVAVDASGSVVLPLAGKIQAAGHTPSDLATEIERRLAEGYIINPRVSVQVQSSASQRIAVSGAVTEAGVFEIKGSTTLLEAIAMAKGLSRTARLNDAVVFRQIGGERKGALFNLQRIQRGEAADPEILAGDTVVVGSSNIKAAWRDLLTAAPLLNVFRALP